MGAVIIAALVVLSALACAGAATFDPSISNTTPVPIQTVVDAETRPAPTPTGTPITPVLAPTTTPFPPQYPDPGLCHNRVDAHPNPNPSADGHNSTHRDRHSYTDADTGA